MNCPHCHTRELINPEPGDWYICDLCLGFSQITETVDGHMMVLAVGDDDAPARAHGGRSLFVMDRYSG